MTVSGPIAGDRLGFTLIHEHLLLDLMRDAWIGNNILNDPELALIELQRYKQAGGVTLVDQTNRGLAQDPLAVKDLAERSGVQIILGCGWYRETYYEPYLYRWKTDQIADQMVTDINNGIDDTGVRAGTSHGFRPPKSACCARPGEPTAAPGSRSHCTPPGHRSAWTSSISSAKRESTRGAWWLGTRKAIRCSRTTRR